MPGEIVRDGTIPADGILELLRSIEVERTSGVLRFERSGAWREVPLVAGQLALDQPTDGAADPVEELLAAREGKYEVVQRLPPLAVSQGDARVRTGSLAVHVPVDLMAYCERAGLTGVLEFTRDDERAEASYDKGELTAIQFGGHVGGEVNAVFAWESGTFKIEALPKVRELDIEMLPDSVPPPSTTETPTTRRSRPDETVPISRKARRRRDDTGQQFLKVVEMTLGAIVQQAEKGRSPTRTSPPLPPAPQARPESVPPSRPSREATVRIIYLTDSTGLAPTSAGTSRERATTPEPARDSQAITRIVPPTGGAPLGAGIIAVAFGGLVAALGVLGAAAAWLLRAH